MSTPAAFEYTWKVGIEYWSRRSLRTNRPLSENMLLIDLYDGHRYAVQAIFPAGPKDREFELMPETTIQTWPMGSLSHDGLAAIRAMASYVPDQFSGPRADIVFSSGRHTRDGADCRRHSNGDSKDRIP
jgi:hypothetical protein